MAAFRLLRDPCKAFSLFAAMETDLELAASASFSALLGLFAHPLWTTRRYKDAKKLLEFRSLLYPSNMSVLHDI